MRWIAPPSQRTRVGVGHSPTSKCVLYGNGGLYEIAAAYAYHLVESQAYIDGNKRTAAQAALDFLEINGVDTTALPELATHEAMMRVSQA